MDDDDNDSVSTQRENETENEEGDTNAKLNVEQPIVARALEQPKSFKKPKTRGITSFQSQLLQKLEPTKTVEEEDPEKLFLLSIPTDFKALKDDEKLDFRLHVLNFFRDVRRKTAQQSSSHAYEVRDQYHPQYTQYHPTHSNNQTYGDITHPHTYTRTPFTSPSPSPSEESQTTYNTLYSL